jgi:ABC-2 type transport system permease protein
VTAGVAAAIAEPVGDPSLATQVGQLAKRSIKKTMRQISVLVPGIVFPLFFLAVNSSGLSSATDIPGFPTDSYLTFALATSLVQAALFGVFTGGGALAQDIQTGFLSRLALTPMRGAALLAGQLAGAVVLGLIVSVIIIAVGLAAGATVAAGPGGVVVLLLLAMLFTLAFASIGVLAAVLTGSPQAIQPVFPLLFILMFLSSMALPRNLIEKDWFRTIATANPLSYLIEAPRSLLISGWDAEALALGCGVAALIAIAALGVASSRLRSKMLRA